MIVKIMALLLQVAEQIRADICLHLCAKHVSQIGYHKIQQRADHITDHQSDHDYKEGSVLSPGEHIVKGGSGNQRECQIHTGDQTGAKDVQEE